MKKKLFLTTLALCCMSMAFAQDKKVKITGDVTDYETNEPIIATVVTAELLTRPMLQRRQRTIRLASISIFLQELLWL